MSAAATGRSSEGEASVKADEGPLDRASIAAPATTAIALTSLGLRYPCPPLIGSFVGLTRRSI
jgi:hypothetical protein